MRSRGKIDANQPAIVQGLLDHHRSVETLAAVGGGVPDLLVGYRGRNYLMEVKNPEGRGVKLTHDQEVWHGTWRGTVHVVTSLEQALTITEEE